MSTPFSGPQRLLATPSALPLPSLMVGSVRAASMSTKVLSATQHAKREALHQHLRQHAGYSLMEVLLGIAVVAGVGVGVYMMFGRTDVAAEVTAEQQHINTMLERAGKAYGRVGTFEGMSAQQAVEQGWAPRELVEGNTLRNTWGTPVTLAAETINGRTNAGVRVTYENVNTDVCTKLANAIASSMWDVQVNGQSVIGEQRGEVDPNTMVARCNDSNNVDVAFIHYNGAQGFLAVADPIALPCPPPKPQQVACPPGEFGYIQQQSAATCAPGGEWDGTSWGPWTEVTNTCDPNEDCVAMGTCPPPVLPGAQPCVAPEPQTQNLGCPAGQIGSRIETRTASCPAPTGGFVWSGWVQTSISCTPAGTCPAPQTRNPSCPAGQTGNRSEQRDCTGMSGSNPQWGTWYTIADTCAEVPVTVDPCWVTNTCAPTATCTLPSPNPETQQVACPLPQMGMQTKARTAFCQGVGTSDFQWTNWYDISSPPATCYTCPAEEARNVPENRVATCPAGQYGSTPQTRQQPQTRTYTCPQAAGPGVPNPWTNSAPVTAWLPAATCTPCPASATVPQTQWVAGTCPAGQLGTIEKQQTRTQTNTYTCPANTATLPSPVLGNPTTPWVDNGITRNSTCAPACVAPPMASQTQWLAQVQGPSGCESWEYERRQTRTYSCPAPTGPYTTNPWTPYAPTGATRNYSNTCGTPPPITPPPPSGCSNPAPSSTPSCPSGNQTGGTWSRSPAPACTWTYSGGSCAPITPPPPSCPTAPAPQSQWVPRSAACPPGHTLGSNTWEAQQTNTWISAPAPTCGSWSGYADNGATRNHNNTCAAPAPTCSRNIVWDNESSTIDCGDWEYSFSYTFNGTSNSAYCSVFDYWPSGSCPSAYYSYSEPPNFATTCSEGDTIYRKEQGEFGSAAGNRQQCGSYSSLGTCHVTCVP